MSKFYDLLLAKSLGGGGGGLFRMILAKYLKEKNQA